MSEWTSIIQTRLLPGEQILSLIENLEYELYFVPHAEPTRNFGPSSLHEAAIALTNRRIIALLWDSTVWKQLSFTALNGLSERFTNKNKPNWPYQAILIIPGGIELVLQTQRADKEQERRMSRLLVQGLLRFGVRRDDDGAVTAIVDYEEQMERRRREDNTNRQPNQ